MKDERKGNMDIIVENQKQMQEIEKDVPLRIARANQVVIRTEDDVVLAKKFINEDKEQRNKIIEYWKPLKEKTRAAYEDVRLKEKALLEVIDNARKVFDQKIITFYDEQERIAREEAEKEAERLRKEKEKILAKVEKQIDSLSAKQASLQDQIAVLVKMLESAENEVEAEIIQAKIDILTAKSEGATEKIQEAQTKIDEVSIPEVPVTQTAAPQVGGVSAKTKLIPEVVSPMLLVRAVAEGKVPIGVVKAFDITLLARLVNSGMNNIPGIRCSQKRTVKVYKERG